MKYLKTYKQILNESLDDEFLKERIDKSVSYLSETYESRYIEDYDGCGIWYDFFIYPSDNIKDVLTSLEYSIQDLKIDSLVFKLCINKYNTCGESEDKYRWVCMNKIENNLDKIKQLLLDGLVENEVFELGIYIKNPKHRSFIKESLEILSDMDKIHLDLLDKGQLNQKSQKFDDLILTYKEKIDECILYLTDIYNVEYNDPSEDMGNQGEIQDSFQYTFSITIDDNIDECIDAIKSSIEKIKYDLNGDCEFIIDFVRGSISGILEDVEFKLREEYEMRTKRVKEILNLSRRLFNNKIYDTTHNQIPNKDVATINLIIM